MTEEKIQELTSRLPKWPQMLVTGTPVTQEQAIEIILRTDDFFFWHNGNNHEFIKAADKVLGMPREPEYQEGYDASMEYADKMDEYRKQRKCISSTYITNCWISSSYIGGPHGWCHPDGNIGFADNVGKWPSVEEVKEDWDKVAAAFPFLELEVTLMSGENCEYESTPVVSMLIRNGEVTLVDPTDRNLLTEFGRERPVSSNIEEHIRKTFAFSDLTGENAIPLDELKKWSLWYDAKLKKEKI